MKKRNISWKPIRWCIQYKHKENRFRGTDPPNLKLASFILFYYFFQNHQKFLCKLKQIVHGTKSWHWDFKWTIYYKMHIFFPKSCWLLWERALNMLIFGLGCKSSLLTLSIRGKLLCDLNIGTFVEFHEPNVRAKTMYVSIQTEQLCY